MMCYIKKPTRYFHAGGITFQLDSEIPGSWEHALADKFTHFEVEKPGPDTVQIRHHLGSPPREIYHGDFKTVLDNGTWKISISDSTCLYRYNTQEFEPVTYSVINIFDPKHCQGNTYFKRITQKDYHNLHLQSLTGLGSDQVLMSRLLADRQGFLLHANGVSIAGKTLLFTGKSGSGKSTISGIMKKNGGTVFCDDRVIIQKKGDRFTAAGSWVHPWASSAFNFCGKIDAVFIIEQSTENKIEPLLSITDKYQEAMKALVKNFFSKNHWQLTLSIVDEFVKHTHFFKLRFNLTNEIYKMITDQINSSSKKA